MALAKESRAWHIREGEHYVFHLEPPLQEDAALRECLARTDQRYLAIRRVLGQGPLSVKARERLVKGNYWLFASALTDADLPPGNTSMAYGTVDATGIAFTQRNLGWDNINLVDLMTHEEIHLWWARTVGEAPSLLNEGVAAYFEVLLSPRSAERLPGLGEAWQDVIAGQGRSLRDFASNNGFWAAYREGLPMYRIGGALVGYLAEIHGLPLLERLFRNSHYEDDRLASTLERETGLDIEAIKGGVDEWSRRRQLAGG